MPQRDAKGRFPPGNGAGAGNWGGPKKGAGKQFEPGNQVSVGHPPAGMGKLSVADLLVAAGGREEAAARWMAILRDPSHPKHADMVAKASDRMDGASTQRIEIRDVDPDSMTDEELAAIASRGSRASASAEEGKD